MRALGAFHLYHPALFQKVSRFADDAQGEKSMNSEGFFHISANGGHMGWYVFMPSLKCIREVKLLVAREIIASRYDGKVNDTILGGSRTLLDEEGRPYPEKTTSHRLHLLLPRESFVHESVKEGFVRTLTDGTKLQTLSISPRIFLVDSILTVDECNELIQDSSSRFRRSQEKHYAPGFENYRTSLDGHTPQNSKVAQKLWRKVKFLTGMPDGGVEFPRLIKYDTHVSWYKGHMDYFHSYDDKPLEDLRLFVKTRSLQLAMLGDGEISELLDKHSYDRLDNTKVPMRTKVGDRLAKDLGLEQQQGDHTFNSQRLIHHFLRHSKDPVKDFSMAAVYLAQQMLETNQVSASNLANKYFTFESDYATTQSHFIEDYIPYFLKKIETNRHATILPILRAAEEGGHTSFPRSASSLGIAPAAHETIQECRRGLIVKLNAGQALLFYSRLPTGELDEKSEHAGCTVHKGVKYAVNCFTWDADLQWARRYLLMTAEELYP